MSTGKLRINKFEDESNYKSICITIPEDDKSTNIKFSDWTECTKQKELNGIEKSSRLVVKIVSGEELKKIDLDSCAIEIGELDSYSSNSTVQPLSISKDSAADDTVNISIPNNSDELEVKASNPFDKDESTLQSYNVDFSNSLEDSLQKVWKNNARIMQNINMLNKTLNYTKKKEIMDIICPKSLRTYPCNVCGKCFVYETGLRRHYAMRHAILDTQPRWQVVWTCVQCFQVWPRHDQAFKHTIECCNLSSDNQDCVREIKTSLLLQCEFCEKVYTSIPRLLRHSKIHTTARNYECNSCELAFVSYNMAEQHWPVCPWLNSHYCFSLPKMLLCNACDRKFRNYEQLYNHRYKVGHFMTKTHSTVSCVKTRGMLVYQCELCTQWYTSIPQIISHRSQHHPNQELSTYKITVNSSGQGNINHYLPEEKNIS